MANLEQITVGASVTGLSCTGAVSIISANWRGSDALVVTFRDRAGLLGEQLLFRDDVESLEVLDSSLPWKFDADASLLRLTSEAQRIRLAYVFDPYLAVYTSDVEPLPHQITAVYQEMLKRQPLRYVLADDPGAGKTIMTGLLIKELIARGDLKRCLVVTPGSLSEQWQDELFRKFHMGFEIISNDMIESAVTGNVFAERDLCIARLDKLSRNDELLEKLQVTEWDLIVVDEAHKMSATTWGEKIKKTKRYNLGERLSGITRNFLLLTATPHNGKEDDFQLFMKLIDPDRFGFVTRAKNKTTDVSDVMRRLVKEDLLKFDGSRLFPERIATTVNYELSDDEVELYDAVTSYVQEEFNRADKLDGERRNNVGFALTVLQRRLASSPEAIYQSLHRRRIRLEDRLAEQRQGTRAEDYGIPFGASSDDFDEDDFSPEEIEDAEEKMADRASASSTISELEAEIRTLRHLENMANRVRMSGTDKKWEELSGLLQDDDNMFGSDGMREKLIIFTEHRDTLRYLENRIRSLLVGDDRVLTIHGGMRREERRTVQELFRQNKDVRILVATDAAGEGVNLQRAHLMVNYDLPWNPNRLEQRFGRIHRIGQTEVCHLWNLVASMTREGLVFQRLLEKLQQVSDSLGGKVFDVLGKVTFGNRSLRSLLIEAIRYGNDPAVRARMNEKMDHALDVETLEALIREGALTEDVMDIKKVMSVREEMDRMEARKLQPHFIRAFFDEAFKRLGGRMRPRENERFEITFVPADIRNRASLLGRDPVVDRYERICFEKEHQNVEGHSVTGTLIHPGHPLLAAIIDLILERNAGVLTRGAILIDENDPGEEARILFYIEDSIQDGTRLQGNAKRKISQRIHFVEITEDGSAQSAGYAPYLDYRASTEDEQKAVLAFVDGQPWLTKDVEERALDYAISAILPVHIAEIRSQREQMIDKTTQAVLERLNAEIQHWDYRAITLKENEAAGKRNAHLNWQQAQKRADEMAVRKEKRLAELSDERRISPLPPRIFGGSLVIPAGLLNRLVGKPPSDTSYTVDIAARKAVEKAAMDCVMEIEKRLGFEPHDVSAGKVGYDIESRIPAERREESGGSALRFIEVKGRSKGATEITVTRNEISAALNKPDDFILAIVEVDGGSAKATYIRRPFKSQLDFGVTSVTCNISQIKSSAQLVTEY